MRDRYWVWPVRVIPVSNVPEYGTDSVAQFVFALLLHLCHRVDLHDAAVRDGEWGRLPAAEQRRVPGRDPGDGFYAAVITS